jgi:ketosteroid isomerase-like protein
MNIVISLWISLAIVLPASESCVADGDDARQVRAVAEGIVLADNARDIGRVQGSYAPDAVLMPPNEMPIRGWDAIRPRYEALFASFAPAIEGHLDEICVSGSIAFVRGRNGGQFNPRGTGRTRTLNDTYLMLLRREGAATWRISHLMWHSASPAGPQD